MQRSGAAESDQGEVARVLTSLHGDRPQGKRHVGVGYSQNRHRGLVDIEFQRPGDMPAHGGHRRLPVERHLAAKKRFLSEAAEYQVGIGYRRFRSAPAVARRSGICAGADGPHL